MTLYGFSEGLEIPGLKLIFNLRYPSMKNTTFVASSQSVESKEPFLDISEYFKELPAACCVILGYVLCLKYLYTILASEVISEKHLLIVNLATEF